MQAIPFLCWRLCFIRLMQGSLFNFFYADDFSPLRPPLW